MLVKKGIRKKNKALGNKNWRLKVYKEEKSDKKLYWMWRKGKIERRRYIDARKEFRELIEKV